MVAAPSALALALGAALAGAAPQPPPAPPRPADPQAAAEGSVLDEIADIVEKDFYSSTRLEQVGWRAAVARARAPFAAAPDGAARAAVLRDLLATLQTSHTGFYPRDDPGYWALTSIFQDALPRLCAKERLPPLPVTRDDIGVFWKQIESGWYVAGVYAGGPAEKAGLKLGDLVRAADGQPFSPVLSFAGKAGKAVALQVQRTREGAPLALEVTPRPTRPQEEYRRASADSWRILERRGRRLAYLHVWSWTSIEVQQAVVGAIVKFNAEAVDGFILDIRDGWGGASTNYLGISFRDVPVLSSVPREGKPEAFDYQIRKPAVLLTNGGTRSGKETVAYGAKKHRLARLVGERTAGAVVFGQPFCLKDGSLLLLAVADARVDGERLEGRGVEPDVEVPFDLRFAAGDDPQLERALEILSTGAGTGTGP